MSFTTTFKRAYGAAEEVLVEGERVSQITKDYYKFRTPYGLHLIPPDATVYVEGHSAIVTWPGNEEGVDATFNVTRHLEPRDVDLITTNTELVMNLMEHSEHGALSQVFIVEAIRRYAKECANAKPEDFTGSFVSGQGWVGVAQEIEERCEAFYNRHEEKGNT